MKKIDEAKLNELFTLTLNLLEYLKLDLKRWGNVNKKEYRDIGKCKSLIKQLKRELNEQ